MRCGKCQGTCGYKIGPADADWRQCSECKGTGVTLPMQISLPGFNKLTDFVPTARSKFGPRPIEMSLIDQPAKLDGPSGFNKGYTIPDELVADGTTLAEDMQDFQRVSDSVVDHYGLGVDLSAEVVARAVSLRHERAHFWHLVNLHHQGVEIRLDPAIADGSYAISVSPGDYARLKEKTSVRDS